MLVHVTALETDAPACSSRILCLSQTIICRMQHHFPSVVSVEDRNPQLERFVVRCGAGQRDDYKVFLWPLLGNETERNRSIVRHPFFHLVSEVCLESQP